MKMLILITVSFVLASMKYDLPDEPTRSIIKRAVKESNSKLCTTIPKKNTPKYLVRCVSFVAYNTGDRKHCDVLKKDRLAFAECSGRMAAKICNQFLNDKDKAFYKKCHSSMDATGSMSTFRSRVAHYTGGLIN